MICIAKCAPIKVSILINKSDAPAFFHRENVVRQVMPPGMEWVLAQTK